MEIFGRVELKVKERSGLTFLRNVEKFTVQNF